jgi:hypothetical protein
MQGIEQGMGQGMEMGMTERLAKGKAEKSVAIARQLKRDNVAADSIASSTGLSPGGN